MVFLRPVVLRDAKSTEILSSGRYLGMMNEQKSLDTKPLNEASFVLPANDGPTLPDPKGLGSGSGAGKPSLLTPPGPASLTPNSLTPNSLTPSSSAPTTQGTNLSK